MSELKTYYCTTIHNEHTEFYIKSDADKVIAELKAQKAQVEDDCAYWKTMAQKNAADNVVMAKQRAEAFKRECYHKYKRCLAMAERCKFRMYYLSTIVDYEASKLRPNPTSVKRYSKKKSRMYYWKNRWLELADQFKEAK